MEALNIIRMMKSGKSRCAGYAARMLDIRNAYRISAESEKGRDH
jgi:hypothetical protein